MTAALARDASAVEAWRRWRRQVGFADIDAGSYRMLALAYSNLRERGVPASELGRLRGMRRLVWYKNQVGFRSAGEVIEAFRKQDIECMLLKGAALAAGYYRDAGVRAMADVDLFVRPRDRERAIDLLLSKGWRSRYSLARVRLPLIHSTVFVDDRGAELDLHWYLLEECCRQGVDAKVWECAEVVRFGELSAPIPSAAHLLFHTIVHGVRWEEVPPLRWVADSAAVLEAGTVDWARLVAEARSRRLTVPLEAGLDYLARSVGREIPEAVLEELRALPASREERREFELKTLPRTPWRRLRFHWLHYRLGRAGGGQARGGFLRYLQARWGLNGLWQMPVFVIAEAARRTRLRSSA